MEKFEQFKPDEETIESWLDGFEARLLCHNIQSCEKKCNWCQALVGEAGRSIIKKLPRTATWEEVKRELCDVLGEADPKERAIEGLLQYKPKDKGLGEIAAVIITKAARATDDVDMQANLGLKAFLKAIPESIGRELRRKHFQSVWEALLEAKFLQTIQDNEDLEKGKVLTVAKEEEKPRENRVDLEQVVGECLKQLQAQANVGGKNKRPGNAVRGKIRCWCCGEEGHFLRQCPTVKRNRAAQNEATRPKKSKNKMAPDGARRGQRVPDSARGCQTVPDGARGCQMVPEGARGCQRGQIGTFVAPVLDKASQLIVAKVTIAEVEVAALVDTGATTSCCRWGWYKKWKSHLGSLRHSSTMIVGVGNVPIEVKGLSKPLMLQWDGVEGQCQLMVLITLTDVDVVLGMNVLSQFDVKIDSRNQVASPERELCAPLILTETVGLLLENPTFILKGKIQVKEEEAEEVIKGVHRQGHLGEHKTWKAFNRKFITTEGRKKCRKIDRTCPECRLGKDYRQRHLPKGSIGSSRPWDQEGYVKQLKRELEDIRAKLSRILRQEKVVSGGPLLDLWGQRSEEEGGSCDASQQQFVFRYETSVRKQQNRPTRFKLAYIQNASNRDKVEFGIKSCKKAKIYRKKSDDKFWNPYVYLIMCISMICIYLRKQVNKWQPVELPTITSGFDKLYAKVKMAPETCQMGRKHYDKSNGNFWDTYGYVKMYICMIYMYLTKQVNRLKLVRLQTRTSDLAKLYTIDEFGAESCQTIRKQIHKFHDILWNAYSYLKGRIVEFRKYLRTVILGWRSRRPLATPPDGVYKEDWNSGVPE